MEVMWPFAKLRWILVILGAERREEQLGHSKQNLNHKRTFSFLLISHWPVIAWVYRVISGVCDFVYVWLRVCVRALNGK